MVVTILYLFYLAIPIALLIVGSFGETWFNTLLPRGFTFDWYVQVASDGSFRRAFATSLTVCAITCVLAAVLGLPLAYAIHNAGRRGVRLAAHVASMLPIAAPPLVVGFGFILVFSSDALPYLGSLWVLVGGHLALTLPYMLSTLIGDMRHLDLEGLERAAASLGAGFVQRLFHIVVPSLRHSLLTGTIAVAALSIGEFQLSNLVAGFLLRPYPVVLLQAFYGATGFACAATVVLLVLALVAAIAGAASAQGAKLARGAAG